MHTLFLIVGESASGKDTLVNKLAESGYKVLNSYTTRPRREHEEDTHIFISPDEAELLKQSQDIIAYTRIGEYEYFSTKEQLCESDIYIIDPNGVSFLKEKLNNVPCDIRLVTIYINVPEDIRLKRALYIRGDKADEAYKRFEAEKNQFKYFRLTADYDYSVLNIDVDKAYDILSNIILIEKLPEKIKNKETYEK